MKEEIFIPAVQKHNIPKQEQGYIVEFFTKGVVAIVCRWLDNDCADSIEFIMNMILKCVGFES